MTNERIDGKLSTDSLNKFHARLKMMITTLSLFDNWVRLVYVYMSANVREGIEIADTDSQNKGLSRQILVKLVNLCSQIVHFAVMCLPFKP